MHAQKDDLILYVGAASGYHTTKLADMFPNVEFHLWDPREFETEKRPNIRFFQEFFTDQSAESYATALSERDGKRMLFLCDLRNMSIGSMKKNKIIDAMDELVSEDMILQKKWCQMMKPAMAYLKFRLPYEVPTTKYLSGTIYLQPYNKVSTETRLMTNNYNDEIVYDNLEFQEILAYHNAYNRCTSKSYDKWTDLMKKYRLKNVWDNALALYITRYYLKHVKNNRSMEDVGKLFMEIVDFHIDRYGKKYDSLFVK